MYYEFVLFTKSICYHAALMANDIKAKAFLHLRIVGNPAFQFQLGGPVAHILVFTCEPQKYLTQLEPLWGVKAFY